MDFHKRISWGNLAYNEVVSVDSTKRNGWFSHKQWFSLNIACFGSVGGLIFGYDLGVVSGALPHLTKDFNLSTIQEECVVSFMIIGCVIGALIGGSICDRIGRSKTFLFVCSIFIIGSTIMFFAQSITYVYLGRIVIGVGVSVSAIVDISYLTEISPIEYRGAVVSSNEVMITVGILAAFIAGYLMMDISGGWRFMFALPIPVTLLWGFTAFFVPESPKWLLVKSKNDDALLVFRRVFGNDIDANRALSMAMVEIEKVSRNNSNSYSSLWTHWRTSTCISISLMMFQQLSGHACVLAYAPEIFTRVGMSLQYSSAATITLGLTKVIVTSVTVPFIDRVGRRILLLMGVAGMTLSLLAISFTYISNDKDMQGGGSTNTVVTSYISLFAACVYVASYAVGFGPISWLVVSEIFSDDIRGRALGKSNIRCNYMNNISIVSLI